LIELKDNFLFITTKLLLPKDSVTTTGNTTSEIASPIANASLPSEGMNYITLLMLIQLTSLNINVMEISWLLVFRFWTEQGAITKSSG